MEQELPTLPEHLTSPLVLSGVRVAWSLIFCVVLCFVDCCFSFWSFSFGHCPPYFDLWILTTPLISSSSSYPNSFNGKYKTRFRVYEFLSHAHWMYFHCHMWLIWRVIHVFNVLFVYQGYNPMSLFTLSTSHSVEQEQLTLVNVPDEGYFRNASCALNLISCFYYTSGTPEFTPNFVWSHVAQYLVFCLVFCRILFVLLVFFPCSQCICFTASESPVVSSVISRCWRIFITPRSNIINMTTSVSRILNKWCI